MSESKDLAISAEQDEFTTSQLAVLAHAGVQGAPREDLQVFFHQCKRTGLDPFNREIYMIGRKQRDYSGNWSTRYTIQVGIDGFRKIAHRKCEALKEPLSISQGYLATPAGKWVDVWTDQTRPPVAAKVIVKRGAGEFVGVAHYAEYVGLKGDGKPNRMWATKPATMLAKCAEALALRKAFPMEMSGLYTTEEMEQADNPDPRGHVEHKPARPLVDDKTLSEIKQLALSLGVKPRDVLEGVAYVTGGRERVQRVEEMSQDAAEKLVEYMRTRLPVEQARAREALDEQQEVIDAEIVEGGETNENA